VVASAFVATHVPPPAGPLPIVVRDVWLHFVGFVVLGMVTIWRIAGGGARIGLRAAAGWFSGLVAYGLFDEFTQQFVGRTCQLTDWAADGAGAAVGVVTAVVWSRWTRGSGS
jgi:VanZ family protein